MAALVAVLTVAPPPSIATATTTATATGPRVQVGPLPWTEPGPVEVYHASVSCPTADHCVALSLAVAEPVTGPLASPIAKPATIVAVTMTPDRSTITHIPLPESVPPVWGLHSKALSISCPTVSYCGALGYVNGNDGVPTYVVMQLNGGAWTSTAMTPPADGSELELKDISCAEAGTCVVVGSYLSGTTRVGIAETLAEGRWSTSALPGSRGSEALPLSLSCATPASCVAASGGGGRTTPLWRLSDGTWTMFFAPTPPDAPSARTTIASVSCPSTDVCTLLGTYSTHSVRNRLIAIRLAPHGDTVTTLPVVPGTDAPVSIDCATPDSCQVVGITTNQRQQFTQTYDHGAWDVEPLAGTPAAKGSVSASDVSCASPGACVMVGSTSAGYSVVERHTDGPWTASVRRPVGPPYAVMTGVGCSGDRQCTAVGYAWSESDTRSLVTQTVDRGAWSAGPLGQGGMDNLTVQGVACPRVGACVLSAVDAQAAEVYVATQSGTGWSVTMLPVHQAYAVSVTAPSCPAVGHCVVVTGYRALHSTFERRQVWTLHDGAWSAKNLPISDGNTTYLSTSAVSCPTTTSCAIVGEDYDASTQQKGVYGGRLVDRRWTETPIPVEGASYLEVRSVACSAVDECTAVGVVAYPRTPQSPSSRDVPLRLALSDGVWSSEVTTAQQGVGYRSLTSVSCVSPGRCVAVGSRSASGTTGILVSYLSGGQWTDRPVAIPAELASVEIDAVSCGSSQCEAVGSGTAVDGSTRPYAVSIAVPGNP